MSEYDAHHEKHLSYYRLTTHIANTIGNNLKKINACTVNGMYSQNQTVKYLKHGNWYYK